MKGEWFELIHNINRTYEKYLEYLTTKSVEYALKHASRASSNTGSFTIFKCILTLHIVIIIQMKLCFTFHTDDDIHSRMDDDCLEIEVDDKPLQDPNLKPMSKKFFYDVLNRKEFCAAKAKNCCCPTCKEAKSTFDEHLPLFFEDCRKSLSSLVPFMTRDEKEVNLLSLIVDLENRTIRERDFLLSDGMYF